MKELNILREIMQDTKISWWEADVTHRIFRMSDILRKWLGLSVSEWSFDEINQFIPAPYAEYILSEFDFFDDRFPRERNIMLTGPKGNIWVLWKPLRREIREDGATVTEGYVRQVAAPSSADADNVHETKRINDLLYRLNNVSHTLLSLLHTDQVEDSINKILQDILSMFRGGRAYIIEFDWERRIHYNTYEVTSEGVASERELINGLSMEDLAWWTDRMAKGCPVILSSLDELPPEAMFERKVLETQQICSLIAIPLVARDKVRGYVGIDIIDRTHIWTNEDCQWFTSLVNIIGLCLELRRSEQEARDERNYLKGLYRHMPLGYVRLKLFYDAKDVCCDYMVVDSNYAADGILGRSRDSYIGHRASETGFAFMDLLPKLNEVARTGLNQEFDVALTLDDRTLHVILYTTRRDEVICLVTDKTEVNKAHNALFRNEKLLRNIYDNIPVGIELYNCDGYLVDLNIKDMEIFGILKKEDALNVNFFENPIVPPDVRDAVRRGENQSFRLNYSFDYLDNYYSSTKRGCVELYTMALMLYDIQGKLVNFLLINIDNTEITQAYSRLAEFESSFSLVSNYGKVGYCRFDLLSKEGDGVPQWYINLGERPGTPLSEVIGVYKNVNPEDRQAIFDAIRRVKNNEIDSFNLDLRVYMNEAEFWTRVNVMRNPQNDDPTKIEMVCVNYDITELKRTETSLIEAKNKAEVSDRLKSAFLANMSHEIRTPLNAIVGFSNLLSETEDLEERRSYIHIVEENNDLLLKLISDILDLSKIEAGTFDFNFGVVDVNQMCSEAIQSLSLKVLNRPVALNFAPHDDECRIFGDKNRLMQIVINFINNALKFTEQGDITLDYTIQGDEICFSVEDSGSGIAPEQQNSIFERFVKLNSFVQGTGLGLSICKSIVEQMGGHIGVESEVGRGSRFWFSVPMNIEHLQQLTQPAKTQVPLRQTPRVSNRRPVLLVAEDTDSNFLLVSLMLHKEYEIIRACNGEQAVRLYTERNPDAILMDVRMPVMDGLDATRHIRQIDSNIPIIAVTAFAYDKDRQKAMDVGCNDFLTKPLTGDQLRQRLHRLIENQES